MNRISRLFFLLLIPMLLSAGCMTKDLHFQEHAPYQATIRYDSPLVVIMPDDLLEKTQRVEFGGWIDKTKFDVYYGEAIRHEIEARFRKMFSNVAIMRESDFDLLGQDDELAELDILDSDADEDGESEEEEPLHFDDLVPEFLVDPEGYLLRMSNVQFAFENDRPVIIFNAQLEDRAIERTLLEGRLAGRGKTIQGSNSPDTLKRRLSEASVAATNAALHKLSDRMITAIENEALPQRVRSAGKE